MVGGSSDDDVVFAALHVILSDDSLSAFFAFLNDYAHVAMTCRRSLSSALFMDLYAHWFCEWREVQLNTIIQIREKQNELKTLELLCETCGRRPGVEWLAYTECIQCYEDHTD